jgi:thiosulfate reductase cytochrome b subunit
MAMASTPKDQAMAQDHVVNLERCAPIQHGHADVVETHGAGRLTRGRKELIHPRYVRVIHWINVVAIVAMIGSGWEIYNASPMFPFVFPKGITLGGWLAGALLWHFAAMWLFVAMVSYNVTLGLATGRFRRKLLPIRPADFIRDLCAGLSGRLTYEDLSVYNAVQKALISASSSPASSSLPQA